MIAVTPSRARLLRLAVLTCLALPLAGLAQTTTVTGQRAVTVAAPFLQISPDSRSAALGDAGVAIANNANAIYWNPAALAMMDNRFGVNLNFTPWLRSLIPDINHYYLPAYLNLGEQTGTVGLSLTYFSLGRIVFTDNNGVGQGDFNANEFAITGAYARKLSQQLSIGVALKYIYSNLAGNANVSGVQFDPGTSFAGDIGLLYRKPLRGNHEFSSALSLTNLGAKMNYRGNSNDRDFLPATIRVGAAYKRQLDETNVVTFTLDLAKLMVPSDPAARADESVLSGIFTSFTDGPELQEINLGGGIEYTYNSLFSARAGYFYESPQQGDRQYISMGVGVNYEKFAFDFAFLQPTQSQHPLQNTLRFTVGYTVGQ